MSGKMIDEFTSDPYASSFITHVKVIFTIKIIWY